jgi:hypothetical protein
MATSTRDLRRSARRVLALAFACASLLALTLARGSAQPSPDEFQPITASVLVLDEHAQPLPKMLVTAVNREYGFRLTATTGADGRVALDIMPGTWSFYAVPTFERLWTHPGKGYLLAINAEVIESSRELVMRPTDTATVLLTSTVFSFSGGDNYVGFVVEPEGIYAEAHPAGVTRTGTLQLLTTIGLPVRAFVQSYRSSGDVLSFVQGHITLGATIRIDVTTNNSALLEFNPRDAAGNPTDYHIQLYTPDLTFAWSPFITDLPAQVKRIRTSCNPFYMIRGVDACDEFGVRHRIILNPLSIQPTFGQILRFSIGGPLHVAAVRTTPRPSPDFAPATQVMLYMQDAWGNSVGEVWDHVWESDMGRVYPTVRIRHGGDVSPPFEVYGFFVSKLLEQFDRADNPTYDIAWDFGPWGSGQVAGPLYGQEERRMAIDETNSLLSQAPRIDPACRAAQVADYETFAQATRDIMGVPVDYKMGVIRNIAHAGFEDEVQHGYKLETGIELGFPTAWLPGSQFNDHEAGHGRIHKPPCRFFAVRYFGEDYATLIGMKARSELFGGPDYLTFLLGGHDLFLRHQHGAPLQSMYDYIETMQFVTQYINRRYGWAPHRRMVLEWENSLQDMRARLTAGGYTDIEQFAIVYSWLCGENLGALFTAAGFDASAARIEAGLGAVEDYLGAFTQPMIGVGVNEVDAPLTSIPIELRVGPSQDVTDIDFVLHYDPSKATITEVHKRDLTDSPDWTLDSDVDPLGIALIHLHGSTPISGVGGIVQINLALSPGAGGTLGFTLSVAHVNGSPAAREDGSMDIPAVPIIGPFPTLPSADQGAPYSATLWAVGGKPPYRWDVVEDALPVGMTLDAATGEIRGACASPGEYLFRVRATDTDQRVSHRWFTIIVTTRATSPAGWLNPGWNVFSIPLDPVGSCEANALLGFGCANILYWWDPVRKSFLIYPDDFTNLARGSGYLLRLAVDEQPSYEGYPADGDFEIALPEAGWTWIGQPFDHDTRLEACRIRNNATGLTRTAREDHEAPDAWINWNLLWWNSEADSWHLLGLAGVDDDTFRLWYGYLVWSNVRDTVVIVPDG